MADKSSSLRERIIETSLRLFEARGYHKVTVDQIVKESNTSKGGFYHNFKSKDELLYVIHDQFISYILEEGKKAYKQWNTPTERLHGIIKSFVMVLDLYKSQVTVFYQEYSYLAPEYFTEIKVKRDQYKDLMFRVIQDGIDCGEFREELPIPIISMAIFGAVNWICKWYKTNGRYTIPEIADIYADIILHAVLTKEASENPNYSRFFLKSHSVDLALKDIF
ncbi:TetR/AcrR family transcriptional regulator [Neobacillus mesonae]|uniref:TetR family transcriptional regulator n=1 Tax=Neobacillus mesonae TaxID=1193713 RepID=A0A3Q9QV32_9BACI|nr:TetR/AcrR family transcriptional regulator [Neobacillus mesonae]AZU63954.1 TetR family transcriptional regulator [Neobacillus mesonae]MED4204523.1 TetR/AcrR family transcriptional regulator [Neobacillus mesonae]